MDQSMKLFMFFCFAVFFFTGCNKPSGGKARGPEGETAEKAAQKKLVPQPIADEIAMAFEVFREMNGTHKQLVELVTDTKGQEPPKNIFQILYVRLSEKYLATGQMRDTDLKKRACSVGKSELRHKEVLLNNRKSNQYFLYFDPCSAKTPTTPLAMWVFEDVGKIRMRFNVKALLNEPNRVYGSSALFVMGRENKKSECQVSYDTKEKYIESYHCENLSHDFKAKNEAKITKEIFLDQIDYARSQQKPLVAKGSLLDNSVYPPKTAKVIVEDDPSLNQFKIGVYPEPTEKGEDPKKAEDDIFNAKAPEISAPAVSPAATPPVPGAGAAALAHDATDDKEGADKDKKVPSNETPAADMVPGSDGFTDQPMDGSGGADPAASQPQPPSQNQSQPPPPITSRIHLQNNFVS